MIHEDFPFKCGNSVENISIHSVTKMELPKLDLVDEVMRAKVLDALKPLDIDEIKCKKLMTVFDEELDKGKQLKQIILLQFHFLQV